MIEVLAKGLGSKVDEATVKTWFFEEGDSVSEGDDMVELAIEDNVIVLQAPASGVLAEVFFDEEDTVQRDEVICVIDDDEGAMGASDDDDA